MPITYLPYAPIEQGLASIGQALGNVLFPERQRIAALRQNPAQLAELARLTRSAGKREGGVEQLAGTLGVPLDFIQQNEQAFAPSAEELQVEHFIELNGPSIAADTQVLTSMLQGQSAEEAISAGLPALLARSQALQAGEQSLQSIYNSGVINLRMEAGIEKLTVDLEAAELRAKKAGVDFTDSMRRQFESFFASLDPNNPQEKHILTMGAMAIANPDLLRHIQFHENMNFQQSLQLAQQRGSVADIFSLYLKFRGAYTDAVDRATSGKVPNEEAIKDVNTLAQFGFMMQEEGLLPQFPLTEAAEGGKGFPWLIGKRDVEFTTPTVEEITRVRGALELLSSGQGTREELFSSELWKDLSATERRTLVTQLGQLGVPLDDQLPEQAREKIRNGQTPSSLDLGLLSGVGLSMELRRLLSTPGWPTGGINRE